MCCRYEDAIRSTLYVSSKRNRIKSLLKAQVLLRSGLSQPEKLLDPWHNLKPSSCLHRIVDAVYS